MCKCMEWHILKFGIRQRTTESGKPVLYEVFGPFANNEENLIIWC